MQVCSTPPLKFNADLAASTLEVQCRRCGRLADRWSAVVLPTESVVRLRVECHGRTYQRDLAELFMSDQLRVTIDFDAGLRVVDNRGVVHAAQLRVDLPRLGLQAIVTAACYESFGTITSDRVVSCLTCYRLARFRGSPQRR